jgi:hypothetical protein
MSKRKPSPSSTVKERAKRVLVLQSSKMMYLKFTTQSGRIPQTTQFGQIKQSKASSMLCKLAITSTVLPTLWILLDLLADTALSVVGSGRRPRT